MEEDRILVVARIRPDDGEGQAEWSKNGEKNIVRRDGGEIYTFDEVFDQLCRNVDIYEGIMSGLLDSALAGFNTTVCAYGQSGAGKTHTLTGTVDEDGIVQCTFQALLNIISKSTERKYMLRISYVEIYNEKVRDLLSENVNELSIYENKDGVAQLDGLNEVVVTKMSEVEVLLVKAQERRQLGETLLNERSSRSHTIIRLTVESHDAKFGGSATRCSVMNLVDLAGSENAAFAGTHGLRQKEGANINRSLLALSKVVSSLADNQKFIPYRDSKLTRLLKPSLGGNSKTVIIFCVAPFSVQETSSTLKFARQAKKIVTRPVVNEASDDGLLSKYLREIERLKNELEVVDENNECSESFKKTKKENDAEERTREQRLKLSELMNAILNGQGKGDANIFSSRKARRQTWAPGNKVPCSAQVGSLSPPCKKERILGSIQECESRRSDERICKFEQDGCELEADIIYTIPVSVPTLRHALKIDVDVQTEDAYPASRKDEVLTLKRDNGVLAKQLAAKTERCTELEIQLEEMRDAVDSLRNSVKQLEEVNADDLKKGIQQREVLIKELQEKISAEELKAREIRDEFESAARRWSEEKELMVGNLRKRLTRSLDGAGVLSSGKERRIVSERAVESCSKEAGGKHGGLCYAQPDSKEEELQQLRKDKADLLAKLEAVLVEQNSTNSSDEELASLREEVAELKNVVHKKAKELESALCYKDELAVCNQTVQRLSHEKKELVNKCRSEEANVQMLSSRLNALRDEMKEAKADAAASRNEKISAEMELEKLKKENEQLQCDLRRLRQEHRTYRSEMIHEMNLKENKIMNLQQNTKDDQYKINVLEADLAIARKDVERYKATFSNISVRHDEGRAGSNEEKPIREQLAAALENLTATKKAKEKAEQEVAVKEKMIKKAMDTILELETASQSSQWPKEKARLLKHVQDLERQIRDLEEAFDGPQSSKAEAQHLEERRKLCEENNELRQKLAFPLATKTPSLEASRKEVTRLQERVQELEKEVGMCKTKLLQYRKREANGIEYLKELREGSKKVNAELEKTKEQLSSTTEELQKLRQRNLEMEAHIRECNRSKSISKGGVLKSSGCNVPLDEDPECRQQ